MPFPFNKSFSAREVAINPEAIHNQVGKYASGRLLNLTKVGVNALLYHAWEDTGTEDLCVGRQVAFLAGLDAEAISEIDAEVGVRFIKCRLGLQLMLLLT